MAYPSAFTLVYIAKQPLLRGAVLLRLIGKLLTDSGLFLRHGSSFCAGCIIMVTFLGALSDTRCFAAAVAEVVQLRAADGAATDKLD